jgi:hypothetical protein
MVTAAAAAFIVVRGIVGYVVNSAIRRRRFMHAFIVVRANESFRPRRLDPDGHEGCFASIN